MEKRLTPITKAIKRLMDIQKSELENEQLHLGISICIDELKSRIPDEAKEIQEAFEYGFKKNTYISPFRYYTSNLTTNPITPQNINYFRIKIVDLDMSVRLLNGLKAHEIDYLEQLESMYRNDLLKVRNLGRTSILELESFMAIHNINFRKTNENK